MKGWEEEDSEREREWGGGILKKTRPSKKKSKRRSQWFYMLFVSLKIEVKILTSSDTVSTVSCIDETSAYVAGKPLRWRVIKKTERDAFLGRSKMLAIFITHLLSVLLITAVTAHAYEFWKSKTTINWQKITYKSFDVPLFAQSKNTASMYRQHNLILKPVLIRSVFPIIYK